MQVHNDQSCPGIIKCAGSDTGSKNFFPPSIDTSTDTDTDTNSDTQVFSTFTHLIKP